MPYEKQIAAVIKKLEWCRDELGGIGLVGNLPYKESAWISEQSSTLSTMISELEDFREKGEIPEDAFDDED